MGARTLAPVRDRCMCVHLTPENPQGLTLGGMSSERPRPIPLTARVTG